MIRVVVNLKLWLFVVKIFRIFYKNCWKEYLQIISAQNELAFVSKLYEYNLGISFIYLIFNSQNFMLSSEKIDFYAIIEGFFDKNT
jgi:hypothetical protein